MDRGLFESWDFLLVQRFYVILTIGIIPPSLTIIRSQRISAITLIMLVFTILILLRFTIFEPRKEARKFVRNSNIILFFVNIIFIHNYSMAVFINLINLKWRPLLLNILILAFTFIYLIIGTKKKIVKKINKKATVEKPKSDKTRNQFLKAIRKNPFLTITLIWILISMLLIFAPIKIYTQKVPFEKTAGNHEIGFWGSSSYIRNTGSSYYLNDSIMNM
ncbi:MAG: hypothetical protein GF364_03905, partial [Candidatus Lokiarchaeota archaeon]|nr:hypothetical protein [Candidatus Lokiarchaeota archaeon]